MLDIALFREHLEETKIALTKRGVDLSIIDNFVAIDTKWRETTENLQNLQGEQKKLSAERKIEEAKANKLKIKEIEMLLDELTKNRQRLWYLIPNVPEDDVVVGKDDSENKPIRKWGDIPKFKFPVRDHIEIGESLDIIDMQKASSVSGARFYYLKGDAALLEFALIQFGLSILTNPKIIKKIARKVGERVSSKPFVPVIPPVIIRPEVYQKMARLNIGVDEEERYYLKQDDQYLIGSAEHTLGPLHMNETLLVESLPIRYVGFSTCFRREAGSYGKDVKGMIRVHQFDKLEMESFSKPEDSRFEQDFFVAIQEYLMQALKIPYQVVAVCTGDMGGPDARQLDIECWMPGQNKYRETHSADLVTDYQSRRLNTKVKNADGSSEFVHMNDATVFAMSRTLVAILENYQTENGKVAVPKVLRPYIGKSVIG